MGTWEKGAFVEGEWVLRDGSTYKGPFKDGKPIGEGAYTWAKTGNVQIGTWNEDGSFNGGVVETVAA
jgi:hypothetical protein